MEICWVLQTDFHRRDRSHRIRIGDELLPPCPQSYPKNDADFRCADWRPDPLMDLAQNLALNSNIATIPDAATEQAHGRR